MIDISLWIKAFLQALNETFGNRIWFAGLQGSYGREEAAQHSDIDMVVILDTLSPEDISSYSAMLDSLPHREKICGFLSGKEEILSWEASDLFQFCHDTTPLLGSLDDLLPLIDSACVNRAIKIGACNIYHGCVHNMVHEKSMDILKGLYKSAVFVAQAVYFSQTGRFVRRHRDLIQLVSPRERAVLHAYFALKQGENLDFDTVARMLFSWTQSLIQRTN